MKKLICDECGGETDVLWTLEAYNEGLEDYLNKKIELCRKCATNRLTIRKTKQRGNGK